MQADEFWRMSEGLTDYPSAIDTMQERVAAIREGTAGEQVWLVEHPPLYTAGTSAAPADLVDPGRFPVFSAGRGGQWTYHGPGQRTGYVMLDLTRAHGSVAARDVRAYVHGLEEWLIRTLDRFNIRANGAKAASASGSMIHAPEASPRSRRSASGSPAGSAGTGWR